MRALFIIAVCDYIIACSGLVEPLSDKWGLRRQQVHVVGEPRVCIDPQFSEARKIAIERELNTLGVDVFEMLEDPIFDGSPAVKMYRSFVNPREATLVHALSEDLIPTAKRVAMQVATIARQRRSQVAEYLRNKDKHQESAGIVLQPLVLVLDNIRSCYNVGSILRTAETGGICEVMILCRFFFCFLFTIIAGDMLWFDPNASARKVVKNCF